METIKSIYRIGSGPSSSHTMGPKRAAEIFLSRYPAAVKFRVTLCGSLAATGKGHLTDKAIIAVLESAGEVEIVWRSDRVDSFHTNMMLFEALDSNGSLVGDWKVYSVGGGALKGDGLSEDGDSRQIYKMSTIAEIQKWCDDKGSSYWEYVLECEDEGVMEHLAEVWRVMRAAVERGLDAEGVIEGGLNIRRKANTYMTRAKGYLGTMKSRGQVFAYALAVSEENATGGEIVTAPTCGSCGVLPSVLYHLYLNHNFSDVRICRALATAALFGNVARKNASISGAEVGCQGEVGVACAMAAAAACQLFGGSPSQIEYAAEMGLEHHLGLTCDPICGLVQIPCIERNAFAAARALDANNFSTFSDGKHRVSFDRVVEVMKQTGNDLPSLYKETSEGGLAKSAGVSEI